MAKLKICVYNMPFMYKSVIKKELTCGLIIVNTDPVQLQVTVSMVSSCGINAVLIADHFPELQKENGRYHMTVIAKKVRIYPLAMRFMRIGALNEKNSSGFAFFKNDRIFPPFTKPYLNSFHTTQLLIFPQMSTDDLAECSPFKCKMQSREHREATVHSTGKTENKLHLQAVTVHWRHWLSSDLYSCLVPSLKTTLRSVCKH